MGSLQNPKQPEPLKLGRRPDPPTDRQKADIAAATVEDQPFRLTKERTAFSFLTFLTASGGPPVRKQAIGPGLDVPEGSSQLN